MLNFEDELKPEPLNLNESYGLNERDNGNQEISLIKVSFIMVRSAQL